MSFKWQSKCNIYVNTYLYSFRIHVEISLQISHNTLIQVVLTSVTKSKTNSK